MPGFALNFDQSGGTLLDDFALLATQDYNLGKKNDWFGHFRGGLYGHYSRLTGASTDRLRSYRSAMTVIGNAAD